MFFNLFGRWILRFFGSRLSKLMANDKVRKISQEIVTHYADTTLSSIEKYQSAAKDLVEVAQTKIKTKIESYEANALVNIAYAGLKPELDKIAVKVVDTINYGAGEVTTAVNTITESTIKHLEGFEEK